MTELCIERAFNFEIPEIIENLILTYKNDMEVQSKIAAAKIHVETRRYESLTGGLYFEKTGRSIFSDYTKNRLRVISDHIESLLDRFF